MSGRAKVWLLEMKKINKKLPRNFVVLPMILGRRSVKMKDRRKERGGSKNKQQEWMSE